MNTQTSQEKRTIKVKDFLDDFRGGVPDSEIREKYQLTPTGLDKFYAMLLERSIIGRDELDERRRMQELEQEAQLADSDRPSYICPACLTAQEAMFDICPSCGVSFQELLSRHAETAPAGLDPTMTKAAPVNAAQAPVAEAKPADPIEIPMADFVGPLVDPAPENEFLGPEPAKRTGGFDDPIDEILPAAAENIPLDTGKIGPLACDGCHEPIHPGYREVYDQSRSRLALMAAGALLVLGLLGTAGVGYLDFSLARILLLYFTGVSILAGGALLGVGSFMFFARERVYVCSNCERAYPRG